MPLLVGITLISFFLLQLAPGDFFTQLEQDPTISRETLDKLRAEFALDKPAPLQYLHWLASIAQGNFGRSLAYRIPVMELLLPRLFNTIALSLSALLLSWILAIPFGVFAARRPGGIADRSLGFCSYLAMSIPEFFLAFLAVFLAARTGLFPLGGAGGLDLEGWERIADYLAHLAAPAVVLAVGGVASLQRLMRANLVEELGRDYVRTARAKGCPESRVLWRHALPNAVNPMITIFGMQLASVAGGAAFVEIIMAWPGLGQLLMDAMLAQDLHVVMASLFWGSTLLIAGNLVADLALAILDPRIRQA